MREKTDPNWKPPLPPVIELTSENFAKTINEAKLILVQFYAPYCSHCKQVTNNNSILSKYLKNK
jgi:thioredoxin-like negative regulator of GroEL